MTASNALSIKPSILPLNSAWWAFNGHIHTVVSSQFAQIKSVDCKRIEIETPDDDFLEIDVAKVSNEKAVVALFHGLEGSSERFYIRNLTFSLNAAGFSCVALNFRGCGSRINRQKRFYHSGETSDYETLFKWVSNEFPNSEINSVGFSLGGNAMIKYLGENGANHPVQKAVAVSPPYDLKLGSYNLQKGFNRIYEYRFIRTLRIKLAQKRLMYPDLPEFKGSTIFDFDDQVTAPVHGFKNAVHYYDTCSSKNFLESVSIPLMLIHSKKDTLTPLSFAPFDIIEKNPLIESIFTENGGHVGFLSSPPNWLNQTIVTWLNQ